MNQRISRVSPASAGKIFGAMYFVLGLIFVPFMALPLLLDGEVQVGSGFRIGLIVAMPFIYGLMGFVGTAFMAWFYNLFASRIGGVELEITPASHPVGPAA